MLEQFQLPEPAYAALHLVSFLIGAGASGVTVERQGNGLVYFAQDAHITPEAMASPFSALLRSRVEPYLSELALGLNAILGQKSSVELSCAGKTTLYSPDQVATLDGKVEGGLSLKVSSGGERELDLIAEHFELSPVPIKVRGKSIAKTEAWSPVTLQVSLENSRYPLDALPSAPVHVRKATRANFSAVLRVGREASGVCVLHLGRLYRAVLPWTFALRGWQVEIVLNTDRLQKDLTQQTLRENETSKNIFATLRQQLEMSLQDLPLSVWQDAEAQELWDSAIELMAQTQADEAVTRQSSLVRLLQTVPKGSQRANALLRLGLLQTMVQPGSGAENLHAAEAILAETDAWQAWRFPVKARMALSRPTPELEKSVEMLLKDPRATPEDRLDALRWLRERGSGGPDRRAVLTCELARQLHLLRRPRLALAELDAAELDAPFDQKVEGQRLEVRAAALADLGYHEKALESLGRLLAQQREEHGQYSLRLGLTLTRLAVLLEHLGKEKQAREYRAWSHRLYQ